MVPGFYLLYLVAQDESYSIGRWVQLRAAGADGASTFAGSAMRAVPEASARFETTASECVTGLQDVQITVFPLLCLGSADSNGCCGCHLLELLGSLCKCMPAQWIRAAG